MYSTLSNLLWVLLVVVLSACTNNNTQKNKSSEPALLGAYDLQEYQKVVLPPELDEISGIAYDSASKGLVAVNDEEGILFFLDPATGTISKRIAFGGNGDYEEVFWIRDAWWVLQSNGRFNKVNASGTAVRVDLPVPKQNEYEAAWYDAGQDRVWLLCKKCETQTLEMAGFSPAETKVSALLPVQLDGNQYPQLKKFPASAAAVHPQSGEVYIVASPDKRILRMTMDGVITAVAALDPAVFKQPEGICFAPDGTLYISNESAGGNANLLTFKPRKQ